ncbi:MAG: NAD(P)/FAD-dependent oxidoreductase [Clostridia bacterium]|nr:NAD(P)/FAD-dependent oxidoreductase [Clostridia bacterium]
MEYNTNQRVLVVGAGAAGLMAAGTAAQRGHDVTLLERNERPAKKVRITGKGRCNVTNNCADLQTLIAQIPGNGRFLYSAFSAFMPADTMRFFEELGVPLKTERGNRVFPVSDSAHDIAEALVRFAKKQGVRFETGRAETLLLQNGTVCGVTTNDGRTLSCGRVILATGGLSYPLTGSTGDGYRMAEAVGHTVTEPVASLVPLVCHEGFCSDLMGLSLRNVTLTAKDLQKNRIIFSELGEMLFTHFGVSGPLVLSASAHMRPMERGRYDLSVDLKPALTPEQLDKRVQRDFSENINRNYINALNGLLPKKLVPVVVKLSGIPASVKTNQITREQRQALVALLKDLRLTVTGFRPIDEAIVTAGGVKTAQVDPKTMQSKLVPGLFFAGEVLDVDAYTGGFNLQIAFSTGRLAGMSV